MSRGRRLVKIEKALSVDVPVSEEDTILFAAELNPDTPTLDLHQHTVAEALDAMHVFLNRAFMDEEKAVRIMHGNGSGALRDAVRGFLSKHPHVLKWRPAPLEQMNAAVHAVIASRK